MKHGLIVGTVILSALPLFAGSQTTETLPTPTTEKTQDASAAAQMARFAIDYVALRQQAATNENAARGFFLIATTPILSGSAIQEYGADLHGLLDQLGEDHFAALLLALPAPLRDKVLRSLGAEAGYDEPESDTTDFSKFYPILDRMIRSAHLDVAEPASASTSPGPVSPAPAAPTSDRTARQEALAQVSGLPEVQAYGRNLIHQSTGAVKATIFCEPTGNGESHADNQPTGSAAHICVDVGEQHDDHTLCWTRFRVVPATREIEVWSEANEGGWIALTTWRQERITGGSTAAQATASE